MVGTTEMPPASVPKAVGLGADQGSCATRNCRVPRPGLAFSVQLPPGSSVPLKEGAHSLDSPGSSQLELEPMV